MRLRVATGPEVSISGAPARAGERFSDRVQPLSRRTLPWWRLIASLAVAGLTARGLARVWRLKDHSAVVWDAAGALGRMLTAILADHDADVIDIASGKRVDGVRAAG